ncbi:hypothetical protein EV215_1284 [Hypnocyclicus thermotrophus]|uniref:Uncharacterized protein n=1 Tax=Hypnocyclicus thermotrophus TaxID=1627895 RepID=A0AA46I5C3_9FUSO|nr:hypothetical protein [Hypnocyclicus thermotrophus]TDT69749.1 hypothetical protein EV215_1284 [Hypnocyclicus thermotrophus]
MDLEELDIIDEYKKLYRLSSEENRELNQKEIDEEYISLLSQKKIEIKKKLEKIELKNLNNEIKIELKELIEEILDIENGNQKLYKEKIGDIKKDIIALHHEKKLKNTYMKTGINKK